MAWLDRLLGRGGGASQGIRVDALCGDADAHEWATRLGRGDWQGFGDFLRAQQNVETRDFYVRVLPDRLKGWPAWLDEWVETAPSDAMARLFRASRSIRYAWEARGSGGAKTVQGESWPLFFSRLDAADADLTVAADLAPADPGAWVLMITTARGRQLGIEEVRRRFAEVERRYQNHAQACQQVLQAVAAKWGGSHELMFEFARGVSARASDGSPAHAVIADAHYEFWFQEGESAKGYLKRPEVGAEVENAARRCATNPQDTPRMVMAHSSFAQVYLLMGDAVRLGEQLDQAGGIIAEPLSQQPFARARVARLRATVPKSKGR